jgi:hypothetical protein
MSKLRALLVVIFAACWLGVAAASPAGMASESLCVIDTQGGLYESQASVTQCSGKLSENDAAWELAEFSPAEWLVNGSPVTRQMAFESTGELLLEDQKTAAGPVAVSCSWKLVGWIEPSSLEFISEALTLSGGKVNGTWSTLVKTEALECSGRTPNCLNPLAWLLNPPWEAHVDLLKEDGGPFFVALVTKPRRVWSISGYSGYEIECAGIFPLVDECNNREQVFELRLWGTSLLSVFNDAVWELAGVKLAICTLAIASGTEAVVVEGDSTISLIGGGELAVSSESASS